MKNHQKLKIIGSGGQGVKFLSHMLGQILIFEGYEVSLIYDYDAAVRGGDILSELTFSKNKIANPFSKEIDFLIQLKKEPSPQPSPSARARELSGAPSPYLIGRGEGSPKIYDFSNKNLETIAIEKFNDKRLFNMIILGAILRILNINLITVKIDRKFKEAIEYGYVYLNQES